MDFSYITQLGLQWPRGRVSRKSTDHIQIHHTVGDYGTPAKWRALHNKRLEAGNRGVEYSFLILADGTVYEGRGLYYGHGGVKDSLTNNANQRSVAIAFNGDMRKEGQPSEAALQSAVRLINDIRAYYGLPVGAVLGHNEIPLYENGKPTGARYATLCPCLDMDGLRERIARAEDTDVSCLPLPGSHGSARHFPAMYEYVGASFVNLRTRARDGDVIGRVSRGDEVVALQEQEGWLEVVCHEQTPMLRGWCLGTYLERA